MKIFAIIAFVCCCVISTVSAQSNGIGKDTGTHNKQSHWTGIFDDYLSKTAENDFFNGYAYAAEGKLIFSKAYGFSNYAKKEMPGVNTPFLVGSLTKQFTAVLVLQQVQNGKIKLDETIEKYFPTIPNARRITFRMLLSHTSGLANFTDFPEFADFPSKSFTHKYVIERVSQNPVLFEPGARFSYCNSGYYLLGVFLEKVSGKTFEILLNEQILRPAGMNASGLFHPGWPVPKMALGYTEDVAHHVPSKKMNIELAFAAGQLYSTVSDLLRWSNFLDNAHILNDSLKSLLFTPNKDDYGFGWVVRTFPDGSLVEFHSGALPGFRCSFYRIPSKKFVMILLANMDAASLTEKISNDLINYYLGKPYTAPIFHKKIFLNSKQLQAYVGTYKVNDGFSIVVTEEKGKLMIQGTGQDKVEFFPESAESFFITFADAQILFKRNNAGQVTGAEFRMGENVAQASKIK